MVTKFIIEFMFPGVVCCGCKRCQDIKVSKSKFNASEWPENVLLHVIVRNEMPQKYESFRITVHAQQDFDCVY